MPVYPQWQRSCLVSKMRVFDSLLGLQLTLGWHSGDCTCPTSRNYRGFESLAGHQNKKNG